jgi:hypothetical protein
MKIKQSETVVINRSQISFAPYNPRKKNQKVIDALKKNFKKVGFLGGIVWNETSGNIVGGHKRVEALDLLNGYDGKNDYEIKVEKVNLDDKTEKEQNIFLNNKRVQGEMDYEMLAKILPDIDVELAGLDEYDVSLVKSIVPDFNFGSNDEIKQDLSEIDYNEKKNSIKDLKKDLKKGISKNQQDFYFVVTFQSYDEKAEFLESIGINGDDIYLTSEKFTSKLNDL